MIITLSPRDYDNAQVTADMLAGLDVPLYQEVADLFPLEVGVVLMVAGERSGGWLTQELHEVLTFGAPALEEYLRDRSVSLAWDYALAGAR